MRFARTRFWNRLATRGGLAVGLLVAGCVAVTVAPQPGGGGKGATGVDDGAQVAELAQSVMRLDPMVGTMVDGTADSLTFRPDPALDAVAAGDVVVSADPAAPFLRRVTERVTDADGRVTFTTQDVGVDELFTEANVSQYAEFLEFIPADGVEVNSQSISLKPLGGPVTWGDTGGSGGQQALGTKGQGQAKEIPVSNVDLTLKLTDHNGEGTFNVKLALAALLEIERPRFLSLRRLKTSVIADYEFGVGLSLKLKEFLKKEREIGQYRLIFWIGPVPIYAEINLVLEMTGDVKAAVSVSFKGHVESGGEWTDTAGWRRVHEHQPLVGEGKAQGEVSLATLAVANLRLYKLAGPKIGFGPSFTASISSLDLCAVEYEVALKVEATLELAKWLGDESLDQKSFGFELKEEVTKGKLKLCEADKPDAPTNLQAARVGEQTRVALTWKDNSNNEANFLVQWNDGGGWQDVAYAAANSTSYVHANPSVGLDNLYLVYAVGAQGTLSGPSNVAGVTLEEKAPPAAPAGLVATADGDSLITLAWTDLSDDESGFLIERSTDGGGSAEWSVDADVEAFADRGVERDRGYTYRVRAYSAAGLSDWSDEAQARTSFFDIEADFPAAPGHLSATAVSETEIALQWTDHSSVEEAFVVERAGPSGVWSVLAELAADAESYSDTGLTADTTYSYRVRARNDLGDSAPSNTASARTYGPDVDEPDTPPPDNTNDNGSDGGPEYVVWYTGNVACWDAPHIYIDSREYFEAWQATASIPGGGLDWSQELVKVEMQGGFATVQDAQDWICPQFVSQFRHYWCGTQYFRNGSYWQVHVDCDLSGLPVDE